MRHFMLRHAVPITIVGILLSLSSAAANPARPDSGPTDSNPGAGLPSSAAETEFVSSRFLIRLEEPLTVRSSASELSLRTGRSELDAAIAETGVHKIEHALRVSMKTPRNPTAMRRFGLDRTYRFHVARGSDIRGLVKRFSQLSGVAYAEPDGICRGDLIPDDTLFPTQQWNLERIDGPEAWNITTGDDRVIAVLDTGIDLDHEDLAAKLVAPGFNFVDPESSPEDDDGHGTGVASILAAVTNNTTGIAGVNWNARLRPVKVFASGAEGTWSDSADGVVQAVDQGDRLLNYSGGGTGYSQTMYDAVRYAYDAGAVLVSTSGNENSSALKFPGRFWETIAVGVTDSGDWRWDAGSSGSNHGAELDLVAPGVGVPAATMGGGYETGTGTSFAAPLVTGALGLVRTLQPSFGRDEARHLICFAAEDQVGATSEDIEGRDNYYGFGRLNLHRALQASQAATSLHVEGKTSTRPYFELPTPGVTTYDFVRGDLSALSESNAGVDLGQVVCLENDSVDADTAGDEDASTPVPGEGFFYLGRFNAGIWQGSYGGSSAHRDRTQAAAKPDWALEIDESYAQLGTALAAAGDVNGDGWDDLIIGADALDNGDLDEAGGAFLYLGSAEGPGSSAGWSVSGDQSYAWLGFSVADAGDVNGDGYDDVILGAPGYDNGQLGEGRAYVYFGSSAGLQSAPQWTAECDQADARFGIRVGSAGDVNNDGYDDVLVGADRYDNGQTNEGRVYLYLGSAFGLSAGPSWTFEGDVSHAWLGAALGGAGDVNGDGYDDVVLGAPTFSGGQQWEGRVFVFHGSGGGIGGSPDWIGEIDLVDARFGTSAASAGDVDGDGYDDVIIGAPRYAGQEPHEGKVFVYLGSSSGLDSAPAWSFEGSDQAWSALGFAAAGAGDVNGDGYGDVVAAARLYSATKRYQGRVWAFLGSESGLSTTPDWTTLGEQPDAEFGFGAGGVGDLNADGHDEIAVGARRHDNVEFNEGRVFVYAGSPSGPTPVEDHACDIPGP